MTDSHHPRRARGNPEEHLRAAMEAVTPSERSQEAKAGLAHEKVHSDTRVLLLRQLYQAQLQLGQLGGAAETALEMTATGALRDVAHHDAGRVLWALGRTDEAIEHQRLAARRAPTERRSFQLWCLGTLLGFDGRLEDAARALLRAERWATDDRPLIVAHRAWIDLQSGVAVPNLTTVIGDLRQSQAGRGYGAFVLGMIAFEMGDVANAVTHLRHFLRRHAAADRMQALTLAEEFRRARTVLAKLESS